MRRRDFIYLSGVGASTLALANFTAFASPIEQEQALEQVDPRIKKELADVALNAAKSKGASYADVRIGRYLNQGIGARENRIQNVGSSESYGAGVRVIVNGCWGFAATNNMSKDGIAKTAEAACAVAKANSKISTTPVQLAPQKGYGEVSWKTPIEINAFEVPIKEKVDMLLAVNAAAMAGGANFVTSRIQAINEQKYFASTDGSYIDQDIHRLYPTFDVTQTDPATGGFESRAALSSPVGMGYEYLTPKESEKVQGVVTRYKNRYDILEDMKNATGNINEKISAKSYLTAERTLGGRHFARGARIDRNR